MNLDKYDSAQIWLNKIAERVPLKKPSLFNYFLSSRQAEVYYYNGLQRLGLQESERSLQIATALNDSLLLADSYNFIGLFYMNLDSLGKSIELFTKGMNYTKQPPYPQQYLSLTKPHHLYGNQAEAYYKLGSYDTAILLAKRSLQLATAINWQRGMSVANTTLGLSFHKSGKYDDAIFHHTNGMLISKESGDIDVELVCYGGLGLTYSAINKKDSSFSCFRKGFDLLNQQPFINNLFYQQFLNQAIEVYKKYGEQELLISALQKKAQLENERMRKNDLQMNTLLNASLKNETRLLALEVEDAQQKQQLANTRFLFAMLAFALLSIVFLVYRYYQNQKLSVSNIREKISQDLHDDIGASLSSLQIYGTVAAQSLSTNPAKAGEMLQKINMQSKEILENMSDIVWSMKTNNTEGTSLETKVKNYASELLQDKQIEFLCTIQPEAEAAIESMKARKNVLLIIREILNNTVKYSQADKAMLHIYIEDKNWVMEIADNGKGFEAGNNNGGNGLKNIKQRCEELKGVYTMQHQNGVRYLFVFPLEVMKDTGWI